MDTGLLHVPSDDTLPNTDVMMPYMLIGDKAYPLRMDLMKPYPFAFREFSRCFCPKRLTIRRGGKRAHYSLHQWGEQETLLLKLRSNETDFANTLCHLQEVFHGKRAWCRFNGQSGLKVNYFLHQ
ncbi:hypothetical protein N1851_021805 [Merluccius polli]|uniref:DDE Tnp4 domain-containing protein n=1 Tax=Merluccius polli TaxID=89951 RepID=A0AA47MJJ2_MERPO|nr:hypothetical protein N1851_021805 [Merluccius polli]